MKIKHFYSFDLNFIKNIKSDKLDKSSWEILRADNQNSDFSIEKSREDYIESCENSDDYQKAAKKICHITSLHNWNKIVSLGVGKGILEYHIKKLLPEVEIICTDYTQNSLELLKNVLLECNNFQVFDMLNDDWRIFKEMDALIMFRLSTEFSQKQWYHIFKEMHAAGIKNVIFIPTELLNIKILLNEKIGLLSSYIRRRKTTFCGWMYSEKEFKKFFSGKSPKALYIIENTYNLDNYTIFELKRN